MRILIQKSLNSSVSVDGKVIGEITKGFVILVGVTHADTLEDVTYCARKIRQMRLFEDEAGKMNLDLEAVKGQILSISQFTLHANTKKGNRPSFIEAARPEQAEELYHALNRQLEESGLTVATGEFGAMMQVNILNDGPVTILLDSKNR
ncbi:D-aminoacyl-tRNA deacylase [Fundicoccus culcitae]|uniref:D-aminoacyl-tRNA deacylase n=1 Tax=Fundicoccus culcitae TaxID=2969821 RepID=A0ABY5P6G6_9LACT|nr:D-aminoacyl-tRNA deacylase [Fundicoccus culcitae]UUX34331.1 D-aminoacyl-tRNA deacylase [Fundicoccus culcitae]